MTGQTIGKYRIVRQLGRGGMGTVYKAVDEVLGREVAIKILNSRLADAKRIERFRSEAIALARLNHPGIATIYDLFPSEEDLLLVMELVRGETLDRISDRMGAVFPEHAAYVVDKVLSALEHAHRAGIVHRDLKPANVMVTDQGIVKVMDFGVARVQVAERADTYMVGTPAYMSPEQVLGQSVDGRSDLYSVGVVFYRLLTGSLPFKADTTMGMLQKQIFDAPPPLHEHRTGLPDWCEPIVQRALAKAPAGRFQSAGEFREALEAAAGIAAPELAKAFSICCADADVMPSPGHAFERFGLGSSLPDAAVADRESPTATGPLDVSTTIAESPVLLSRRARIAGLALASVFGGITALTVVAPWRPSDPPATIADVPVPAAPPPAAVALPPVTPPAAQPSQRAARVLPVAKKVAPPVAFEARTLVNDGDHQRERECQVVLADGTINIHAKDEDGLVYAAPYDRVLSISYSRGRDPFWNAPAGPTRVARAGGSAFGLFRGARHWVSLRTRNAQFVVLRLKNDEHAERVLTVLEERTGRRAELVAPADDES